MADVRPSERAARCQASVPDDCFRRLDVELWFPCEIPMHLLPVPHFEDLQLASGRTASELETELRILLAVKLFELKRVSIGQAANIAGIGKIAFMDELGRM